jgi:hypothetical protein
MPVLSAVPVSSFAILWAADTPAEQSATIAAALACIQDSAARACARWPHVYGSHPRLRILRPAASGQAAGLTEAAQKYDCAVDTIDATSEILARLCDLVVVAQQQDLSFAGLTPALILPAADGDLAFSVGRAHPLTPERRHENDILPSAAPEAIACAFAPPSDPMEAKNLTEFMEEPDGAPVGRRAYDLLLRLIGQRTDPARAPDVSWDHAFSVAAQARPSACASIDAIHAAYLRADALALAYGERWRSTLVSRSMLLLMMNALSGLIGALAPAASLVTIPIQILVTGAIFYQSRVSRVRRWRQKWLDYRRLAESLRVQRFLVLCGAAQIPSAELDWVAWMVQRIARAASPAEPLPESVAPAVLSHLLKVEIAEQIAYHDSASLRFRRLDRSFRRAALAMLFLFVALGVVFAALALAFSTRFSYKFGLSSAIGLALTAAPTLYALLNGVRRDLDVVRQAERSDFLAARLKNLAKAIAEMPPTAATAQAAAVRAAHIMRDDVARWRNVVEVL